MFSGFTPAFVDLTSMLGSDRARQRVYSCPVCSRSYLRKDNLGQHMKNSHGTDARPFVCQLCNRIYRNKNTLRCHVYHTHRKPRSLGVKTKIITTNLSNIYGHTME